MVSLSSFVVVGQPCCSQQAEDGDSAVEESKYLDAALDSLSQSCESHLISAAVEVENTQISECPRQREEPWCGSPVHDMVVDDPNLGLFSSTSSSNQQNRSSRGRRHLWV